MIDDLLRCVRIILVHAAGIFESALHQAFGTKVFQPTLRRELAAATGTGL
jgi:hypothetical protein